MPPKLSVSHAFETHLFSCPCLNTSYSWYTYGQINQSKISWKHQACYASTHHLCISHAQKSKKNLGWVGYIKNTQSKLLFKAKPEIKVTVLQLLYCPGPWPVQACTTPVIQILQSPSNLFECLTTSEMNFPISSWSFLCCNSQLLHLSLLPSISQKNLHFFYSTDPTSSKAARKLLLRPFFMISLHINSKVTHKKKINTGRYCQKRGRHTRQQLDVSSAHAIGKTRNICLI